MLGLSVVCIQVLRWHQKNYGNLPEPVHLPPAALDHFLVDSAKGEALARLTLT